MRFYRGLMGLIPLAILHSYGTMGIPSGHQTWRAGKWTIELGDVPS